ncbi:MAG: hypothetical protein JKY48_17090 [Flavobacteriales bacterium]|nr:hypothetical protein [Flavobacteriales bacterium]
MSKGKKKRIRLESQIQQLLQRDNGVTAHFDYKINMNSIKNTIELNLLTFNPIHDDYMLLRKESGRSAIECLESMYAYIRKDEKRKNENSYTISWKQKGSSEMHHSYFRGTSEKEVMNKFLHEKKAEGYEFSIKMNPIT